MIARLPLAAVLGLLATAAAAQTTPPPRHFVLDRTAIVFGIRSRTPPRLTPPQPVYLESTDGPPVEWTASTDRSWLAVEPSSGRLPARITLSVSPESAAATDDEARLLITDRSDPTHTATVRVMLKHVAETTAATGSIDAPAEHSSAEGSVRFSGWALHPLGLSRLTLCRELSASRSLRTAPDAACGDGRAYVADATVNYLKRPDVAAAFPGMPLNDRAGWTAVVDADTMAARGTVQVLAVATGIDGSRSVVGSRTVTLLPSAPAALPPALRTIVVLLLIGLAVHALFGWVCVRRLPSGDPDPPLVEAGPSRREIGLVVLPIALSLAMSLPALRTSLTYDELYLASLYAVDVPVWKAALDANTFIHIGYALAAAVSVRLIDTSEFALRLPAALFGAAAVFAVWRYGRALAGPATGLMAALVLALLPFHAHWSRMAKGYTGLALTTLLALHAFAVIRRGGSRRVSIEHAGALAIGMYFHLYAVWIFLVQYATFAGLCWTSVLRRERPAIGRGAAITLWWSFLAGGLVAVALYAPVARDLLQPLAYFGAQTDVSGGLVRDLIREFSGVEGIAARGVVLALAVAGAAALARRSPIEAMQLVLLLVLPVAVIGGVVQPKASGARYFGYWIPVWAVLLAAGLTAIATLPPRASPRRRIAGGVVAAALLVFLATAWAVADTRVGPRDGYGERLAPLNASPPQRVFVVGADSEMFRYYVREPLGRFTSPDDLEHALLTLPPFRVAYHDVEWNAPEHRQMHALLQRRCPVRSQGLVTIFACGSTSSPTR